MTDGVLVLGMHRSGTSAVAGLLDRAGLVAGVGDDLMPSADDNPAGFFERLSVVRLNDRLLHDVGAAWDDPPSSDVVVGGADDVASLVHVLAAEAGVAPIVVKDPRASLVLPAWLATGLLPVLVVRNPLEVARSLAERDGMAVPVGLALWELYSAALLDGLEGRSVLVVQYDDLLADSSVFLRAVAALGVPVGAVDDVVLDAGLRHHAVSHSDLAAHLTPSQSAMWSHLSGLTGTLELTSPAPLCAEPAAAREAVRGWASSRATAAELAARATATALQVDALHAEVAARDEEIRTLHAEVAVRDERVSELRTAFDLVAIRVEEQHAEITQRAAAQGEVERLNGLLHEAKDRAEAGFAELSSVHETTRAELASARAELEAIKQSESWRIGQAVVKPWGRLRKR